MAYLFYPKDYLQAIQQQQLDELTSDDSSILVNIEASAVEEIKGNLKQRYDLAFEFKPLTKWSYSATYKAGDRIYLDASAYSAAATYALNALVLQSGNVYICTTAIVVPEAFTIGKWTLIGEQYDYFYAKLPAPRFLSDKFYYKDDTVFFEDKVYTATRDSIGTSHESALQAGNYEALSAGNPTPGTLSGNEMWGSGTAYTIASGTLPTNSTYWTSGDNRTQLMVDTCLDLIIYNLCKRIAPDNVPEVRHNAWVQARALLKDISRGNVGTELPLLSPKRSTTIAYGGSVRQINNY